ncbi:MAG: hypothetical protein B7Y90_00440 [Alphaproteobacteria bacterium 32-64-14]|nr:MAG: hypothetical protein B7Y90_00440 [Alphaproteobacteria bacterium 32-64-14]
MSIRHALGAAVMVAAALTMTPAFAQKAAAKGAVEAPVDDPIEAPEPEYNPAVEIDLGAFETCMTVYDQWELDDDEKTDTAALETACTEAIKTHTGYERRVALSARAGLRWNNGRKEEAVKDYGTLIYLEPRNIYNYQGRASLYSELKRYDLAHADIMTALKLAPMNAGLHNSMCWMLALEGKELERALTYCNVSVGLTGNTNGFAIDSRGMVYLKMGKYDLALADYERAMSISPRSSHFMYGRGIVLLRLGRTDEGRGLIDRAVAAEPEIAKRYADYGVAP